MKLPALALLVLACAGCSRCGAPRSAASAEELLPAKPALAASTGALGALAQHGAALADRAAEVPGGELLGDYRKQLAAQLGFDALSREGLLSAGLDPDRSAAFVASLPEGPQGRPAWVVALPLVNQAAFTTRMEALLGQKAGYPLRTEEARESVKLVVFARATPAPRLAYGIVRGYGLLARGSDPAAEVAAAAKRPREQSLAGDAGYGEARAGVKSEPTDLLIFAPGGSELGRRIAERPLAGDTSLALSFSGGSLAARMRAVLPAESRERLMLLLPGGGGELLPLLPPDAPLLARLGLAPAQVATQLERVPFLRDALAALRREAAGKGVDLDKDLFGALKPGVVLSMASAPTLELYRVVDLGLLDWRTQSPFAFVQLAALAEVASKERLLLALDAVAQAMPRVGAQARRVGDGWQVTYAGGAGARFGVREVAGRTIAYLVGGGLEPAKLVPHALAGQSALSGPAGLAVALDLGKLAAALRALPESTYGSGPESLIARSLVDRVVEPFKLLRGSLALAPAPGGLQAAVQVEIMAEPPAPSQTARP